ncbi:hypothetical protein QBC39DRAFT_119344 [Podospora conica]|nr:hypothetical protein QBC39DRAFT_119344 [Schizothecium conicum]
MCEEGGREVGKFLYLGQVAWPTESLVCGDGPILFLNIVGKMTAFLFLALLGRLPAARLRRSPSKMCLSACARTMAGKGGGDVAHWSRPNWRRVCGRSHSDVGVGSQRWDPTADETTHGATTGGPAREGSMGPDGAWQQSAFSTSTEGRGKKVAAARGAVERLNEPGTQVEADLAVLPIGAGATASAETCRAHGRPRKPRASQPTQESMWLAGFGSLWSPVGGPGRTDGTRQRHPSIARPRGPPRLISPTSV